MINPPDELLEDLQSALPPEQAVTVPRPSSTSSSQANGHANLDDHFYDHASHESSNNSTVRMATVLCMW